jgi:Hemopexin
MAGVRLFRAGFEWIDAASYWGNGKVYFFSGDLHIRDDMATSRAEPGYPQFIVGNY